VRVQADRLRLQRACLQPHDAEASVDSLALQLGQDRCSDAAPACLRTHVHALDLHDRLAQRAQRAAAERLPVVTGDDEHLDVRCRRLLTRLQVGSVALGQLATQLVEEFGGLG
jgi:hypothetical protein